MGEKDLRVVITGASSGIGRATALAFAAEGARLALASRNLSALTSLAAEVEDLGGEALVVATDVTTYEHLQALGTAVSQAFGGVDVWVNNAGVATYGAVCDTDVEEIERVVAVNLLGPVHGTKVALDLMRPQQAGVIITVASALGRRSVPLQAAYCAAKHGLLGFDESLRLELRGSDPRIHVVDVLPSSINTPLFAHARSKVGRMPRPIPPVYDPHVVAAAIVAAAHHPVSTVYAGGAGRVLDVAQRVSPRLVDWYRPGPGGRTPADSPAPAGGRQPGRAEHRSRRHDGAVRVRGPAGQPLHHAARRSPRPGAARRRRCPRKHGRGPQATAPPALTWNKTGTTPRKDPPMERTLKDLMTPHPVTLPASATLCDAAAQMSQADIGDVVVVDDDSGSICGVVTDRDIVVRAVAKKLNPSATVLGDICSRDVITLSPGDRPEDAISMMRTHSVRRIPVIENGLAVGVISLGDLAVDRDPESALADISRAPATV